MNITLRPITASEIDLAAGMIAEARAYQRAQGFVQWTEAYPSRADVVRDEAEGKGYLFCMDGTPFGYVCVDFGGEPAYDSIDGAWHTAEPYGVVHRMAFGAAAQGKGVSGPAFRCIHELCLARGVRAMRVDTGEENLAMQHVLRREGYEFCGVIRFQGGPKLAFDRTL